MIVADTSVVVAAVAEWHAAHAVADAVLASVAIAHTLVEAYSVLTRIPEPQRVDPATAAAVLRGRFRRALTLPPKQFLALPTTLAGLGILGGASYDALIALTAAAHGASLVTLDQRALRTYRLCGVEARLLG